MIYLIFSCCNLQFLNNLIKLMSTLPDFVYPVYDLILALNDF